MICLSCDLVIFIFCILAASVLLIVSSFYFGNCSYGTFCLGFFLAQCVNGSHPQIAPYAHWDIHPGYRVGGGGYPYRLHRMLSQRKQSKQLKRHAVYRLRVIAMSACIACVLTVCCLDSFHIDGAHDSGPIQGSYSCGDQSFDSFLMLSRAHSC